MKNLLIFGIVLLVLLTSCQSKTSPKNELAIDISGTLITFSTSEDDIKKLLGNPNDIEPNFNTEEKLVLYDGIMFSFNKKSSKLTEISLSTEKYKTARGIKFENTIDDVKKVYPEATESLDDSERYKWKPDKNKNEGIFFDVPQGKVKWIKLSTYIDSYK